jgi:universal stress protein A
MILKTFASHGARFETEPPALQLKKILVPIDFSPLSQKAFHYALQLSQQSRTELTLLHVLEPIVPATFEGLSIGLPDSGEESPDAKKRMKPLVASAREAGVSKVRSTFCRGLASHEIVEAAKELQVDLIVIGTHGFTGWKHFCIGSTAERVVRAAPCPVLVVREKEHEFC